MKEWRNFEGNKFPLNNSELIPYIYEYFKPDEWLIELTGGEPALYDGIDELCKWISDNNYKALIKTNGLLEIKSYKNIKRVAAFHLLNNPPKFFDEILIVDKIDREAKEKYCQEHNWKYHIIGFNTEKFDNVKHGFDLMTVVNPAGHTLACFALHAIEDIREDGKDHHRIDFYKPMKSQVCGHCKSAIDAWRFADGLIY